MRTCSICKTSKPETEFNKKKTRTDGLQTHCRACNRLHAKRYYQNNRSSHLKVIAKFKAKKRLGNQEKIFAFLLAHPCVDCGEKNPLVLDFDHLRDKEHGVSQLIGKYSWDKILLEIEKCEIRCRNCHSIKTHREQNSYRWKMVQKLSSR